MLSQAQLPLATPIEGVLGRRRAARIPPDVAAPLLDLARAALTIHIGRAELEVYSGSTVWAWGPHASPQTLADLVRRVLAAAEGIYTAPA
jgi:hypothetical protein